MMEETSLHALYPPPALAIRPCFMPELCGCLEDCLPVGLGLILIGRRDASNKFSEGTFLVFGIGYWNRRKSSIGLSVCNNIGIEKCV